MSGAGRGAAERGATEPGATEPGATEHGATGHGAAEHGATGPGATERGATERGEAPRAGAAAVTSPEGDPNVVTDATSGEGTPAVLFRDLRIASNQSELVHGIDLTVARGESVGIVGESGSGKSLTLRALIGLLPRGLRATHDRLEVAGRTGMIFQDPLSALDPLIPVGKQVMEVCRHVRGMTRDAARARALELFEQVGLPDPAGKLKAYPAQLSGGQRQRVVLAIALAAEPEILLCDEPTSALDVTVQAQVLALLERLRVELGLTLVFVSHDIAVVSQVCSRIVVMQGGRVVEEAGTQELLATPTHPYTQRLLASVLEVPVAAPTASAAPSDPAAPAASAAPAAPARSAAPTDPAAPARSASPAASTAPTPTDGPAA